MSDSLKTFALPARIASVLFHPVFIPAAIMAFILYVYPPIVSEIVPKTANLWQIMVSYISILFPVLTVVLLWRLKFIDSIHLRGQKERYGPLMANLLFSFWVYWVFHKEFKAPMPVQIWLFSVFLSGALVFMATIFYKISLHTAGWGSAIVMLVYLTVKHTASLPFLLLAIIIAGMIGSARFYLKEHSAKQVYVGYVVGALGTLLAIVFAPSIP